MKKFMLALMVALLLISGCAKNEPTSPISHPKAENSPNMVHTASITKTSAPKYFIPSAVMPDGSLFGVLGSKLTFWNTQTGEIRTIGSAWSAVLSPDGKFAMVITAAEDGRLSAQAFDLVSRTGICEKELTGYEPPRHFMWSEDGCTVSFGLIGDDDNGILYTMNID